MPIPVICISSVGEWAQSRRSAVRALIPWRSPTSADHARPQATAFGKDAYPDPDAKAAALLHSIARNHALADGNKRLALASAIAFYGLNGRRLTLTNDEAYDLVITVPAGQLDDSDSIAAVLRNATQLRR
jgi:death-on-curing protein